jgi:hypothetical protein
MATNPTETRKPQDWLNLILGACLFVSPWVIGFTALTTAAWDAWIVGAVLAIVALGALWAVAEWEEWVNFVIGIWAIISPWVLGFSGTVDAMWTFVILGVLTALVSAWGVWDYRFGSRAPA